MQLSKRQFSTRFTAALLGLGIVCFSGCNESSTTTSPALREPSSATNAPLTPVQVKRIETFCGDCHHLPDPGTFPKARWDKEVEQGFKFYIDSGRIDLDEPTHFETVRYFRDQAPEEVAIPTVPSQPATHTFQKLTPLEPSVTCVAHFLWDAQSGSMMISDMRGGKISQLLPHSNWQQRLLGQVTNSCRITPCDFNRDAHQDLLVADLGSFPVGDHDLGKLQVWLGQADGSYQPLTLADHLARVVEAQLIDFDEDGDQDVLIAEFGWRTTGSLKLLRNPGSQPTADQPWPVEVLDKRHGPLGVQVADFDLDGKPDYLVSFAQEFETIELYRNSGQGQFEKRVLFQLIDPSYNSSSTTLADINGDGRLDIVHTNGDTMDAFLPKPYHGVRWLENKPDNSWQVHELGLLVGALGSCAADFDGDGDIDIAAVGMLPVTDNSYADKYDSVVWWEQTTGQKFQRHALEQYGPSHAACIAADINADGLPDLVVGHWNEKPGPPLTVYLSQKRVHLSPPPRESVGEVESSP